MNKNHDPKTGEFTSGPSDSILGFSSMEPKGMRKSAPNVQLPQPVKSESRSHKMSGVKLESTIKSRRRDGGGGLTLAGARALLSLTKK